MTLQARILLVSPPGGASATLATHLSAAGHRPELASDFASAKAVLSERPDLLITDVKLAAYNGLHLAIRARNTGTPTIVIGEPDPVLQKEAARHQAVFLATPVDPQHAIAAVTELLDASRPRRLAPRTSVEGLEALADEIQARVVNVSYTGLRLETIRPRNYPALPPYFVLRLPGLNLSYRMQRVWTSRTTTSPTGATLSCGAAVVTGDSKALSDWRSLVDSLSAPDSR